MMNAMRPRTYAMGKRLVGIAPPRRLGELRCGEGGYELAGLVHRCNILVLRASYPEFHSKPLTLPAPPQTP